MKKSILPVILFAILALLAIFCTYIIDEREQGIVLQFGEYKRVVNQWDGNPKSPEAGIKFKLPWENVERLDRRNLDLDFDPVRIRDIDSNPLLVDAFVRYRITDPLQFYKTFRTEDRLRDRYKPVVESSLRDSLGKVDTQTIIAGRRAELMQEIQNAANKKATDENYGIEVIDVRIKRADYPVEVEVAVFGRMEAERKKEAALLREEGKEAARRIVNDAERRSRIIRAEAKQMAETTKGEGDKERNRIYAEAYTQDADFFQFYRSMEALRNGFGRNSSYVMSSEGDLLGYLNKDQTTRR